MPKLNESALTKGELRKLNALKKSVGDDLGEEVFIKWLTQQPAPEPKADPVESMIREALAPLVANPKFKPGLHGYTVKRGRRGAANSDGLLVYRNGARASRA